MLLISIYIPQELSEKRLLWDYLCQVIDRCDGETLVMGDFNEVWVAFERVGSGFHVAAALAFNNFIVPAGLFDIPLGDYSFK